MIPLQLKRVFARVILWVFFVFLGICLVAAAALLLRELWRNPWILVFGIACGLVLGGLGLILGWAFDQLDIL